MAHTHKHAHTQLWRFHASVSFSFTAFYTHGSSPPSSSSLCVSPVAVIVSLRRKGKMAPHGLEGRMISETPHWALTHTWITCRPCQSISWRISLRLLPYGGDDHMSSCGCARGCVRPRAQRHARRVVCVRSTTPCDVLFPSVCMCQLKRGRGFWQVAAEGL